MSATRATPASTSPAPWAVAVARSRVEELAATVGFALRVLADPTAPDPAVGSEWLQTMLRDAVARVPGERPSAATRASAAARVACAFLCAGDLREAHLALLAADNALFTPRSEAATRRDRGH
ncbi:MAG TPA: hypothetical protein VK935_05815 [Actinomycetospora sp.]|nr:hypothetical protein [Actinomycetospora sp.]